MQFDVACPHCQRKILCEEDVSYVASDEKIHSVFKCDCGQLLVTELHITMTTALRTVGPATALETLD